MTTVYRFAREARTVSAANRGGGRSSLFTEEIWLEAAEIKHSRKTEARGKWEDTWMS